MDRLLEKLHQEEGLVDYGVTIFNILSIKVMPKEWQKREWGNFLGKSMEKSDAKAMKREKIG